MAYRLFACTPFFLRRKILCHSEGVTLGTEVTGEGAETLAEASFSDLKYVPYAEGEKIVYDSHNYYRDSTHDITL